MSAFQKYQYRDLSQPRPNVSPAESRVDSFQEQKFETSTDPRVTKASTDKKQSFRVDQNIAEQLGLEEKERIARENKIQKEIDRRWEALREKAEVEGYTKGLSDGKLEAYKAEAPRILERLSRFDALLHEFDQLRERIFTANEAYLMELIGQVTKMIVLKEVELDQDYIRRVVLALLQQLSHRDDIKISISEKDSANIANLKLAVEKEFGKLENTSLEAVPDMPVGSCRVETRFGVLDASVHSQIENIMKALRG